MARLLSLLQLWGLCISLALLPVWFLNGLLWPALTLGWLLILCVAVGTAIAAIMWFVIFGRETEF